jgi:hypothetical protein
LDEGNTFRRLAVEGTLGEPMRRASEAQHPLELEAGDHIGVSTVSELAFQFRQEGLKTRAENHRPDPQLKMLVFHL